MHPTTRKLIILTGAGLSAESGLRTFRDQDGLWENHRIEEVCDGRTWRKNYELVHRFYNARRTQLASAEPNVAHRQIAVWQTSLDCHETVLLTQNVDDLLERAGCRDVVHLHGTLLEMRCIACEHFWNIGYSEWQPGALCPCCQSTRTPRPNIVFFHEPAPFYQTLWETLAAATARDILLVIGTSGVVLPVEAMARQFPGYKILNNLTSSPEIDDRHFNQVLYMPATQAVPEIDRILRR